MKKLILFVLLGCFAVGIAQNKSNLDLETPGLSNNNNPFSKPSISSQYISNNQISATLIEGGCYTLGTVEGKVTGRLDDNCPLTYGHPYAMTSYPLFSIDSSWYTMDSFFPGQSSAIMSATDDSLSITLNIENTVSILFAISLRGDSYEFHFQSTNLDTISHRIGLGLVYDPTHGSGSDGALFINDGHITHETITDVNDDAFTIWERPEAARGLGVEFSFEETTHIIAANWPQIYASNIPELTDSTGFILYDLALKLSWPEYSLNSGESRKHSIQVKLLDPDFSSAVFTRWDIPSFLSIEDNLMFPRELATAMKIQSSQNSEYPNSRIKVEFPNTIKSDEDDYDISIAGSEPAYQQIDMQANLVYEDKVVGISASIMQDDQVLDMFEKLVYVPATPVSDTGLDVTIDSTITDHQPAIKIIFDVKNTESGHYIYNLQKENVFLYENNERISSFSFGKDTTGDLDQADIIFVLDVTGSMGNEIDNVKNNIIEFADSLSNKGIDYQLGLVTFLDNIENVYPFTNDVQLFHQQIAAQNAHGGGDGPENSLDALATAADFDFREQSKRIIIWITDSNYHEQDNITGKSKSEVVNKILSNGIVVNAIGNEAFKSTYYDPITIPSGGNYYNIYGNFRDILLDISRLNSTNKYLISYTSASSETQNSVKLELRYAGLGGFASFDYSNSGVSESIMPVKLLCYPNPFNPAITFSIGTTDYKHGDLSIYNVLGQAVKHFNLDGGISKVTWQAGNDLNNSISTGFYYVALKLEDQAGNIHHEKSKILYLK